jgi:hypothetical protein
MASSQNHQIRELERFEFNDSSSIGNNNTGIYFNVMTIDLLGID